MWKSTSIQHRRILPIVLLVLVGSVAYSNSLNVPFVLDDNFAVDFIGKKYLAEHVIHGSSRRVADITFALNYSIHGLQVTGYHFINLCIHLSTTILLYFMVVSATAAVRGSYSVKEGAVEGASLVDQFVPLASALLFVSHPVQTQAVTYIIQRYTSLATFFYLLSVLAFIRARLALERSDGCLNAWLWGGCTIVAGLLAVGSKQIAATLPVMLLLLELFLFRGRLINRRFFVAFGALCITTLAVIFFKWHGSSLDDLLFDLHHATAEDLYTSRTTYFLTQTRVIATYLRLLCLPVGQNLMHDTPMYTSLFAVPVVASLALHLSLVSTAAAFFRWSGQNLASDAWQRGLFQRLAALGIFWFYLAMAVESSIFPITDVIFEHRIYLPSIGFFMAIAALAAMAAQGRRKGLKAAWTLLVAACLVLGGMTIARNQVWNNTLTLWQDTVNKSPNKWIAVANLAKECLDRNMPEKALPLYVRTMELHPSVFITIKVGLGDALKALNIFESRFTTGEEFIIPGGVVDSGNLDYRNMAKSDGVIYNNLGLAYEYLKEPQKAITAYRSSVTLNPAYDLAWYNLALLSIRLGDKRQLNEALDLLRTINPILAKAVDSNLAGDTPREKLQTYQKILQRLH
jgi:tetratricopeptide (TPR) repeat protein